MKKLKIDYIPKNELKMYVNNAKTHPAEQVEQIKKSIRDFGFNDPIAIWHDNEIIEGHGRLLAVMEMDDIQEIPVIRLDDLTDEERRAYTLVHNKLTTNTGFEFSLLEQEISEITSFDMSAYGFDVSSFDDIDIDAIGDLSNPGEEKEPKKKFCTCPFCQKRFEVTA